MESRHPSRKPGAAVAYQQPTRAELDHSARRRAVSALRDPKATQAPSPAAAMAVAAPGASGAAGGSAGGGSGWSGVLAPRNVAIACALTVLTSSQGLLTTASKAADGAYAYNFTTVPFFAEALKLGVSWWLLRRQRAAAGPDAAGMTVSLRGTLLYLVPSAIYWVHNNVQFLTLKHLDPTTYQIMGNLKIVTTGLLFRLCLGRRQSLAQWIALVLLTVGTTTSQLKMSCDDGGSEIFAAPMMGYAYGLLSALLSGCAAIYTEWVMKRSTDSLYWQNCQLYSFGVALNGVGVLASQGWWAQQRRDAVALSSPVAAAASSIGAAALGSSSAAAAVGGGGSGLAALGVFEGYNGYTVAVIANLALSGLAVSFIMKFADSILKVYSTSMAMFLTMVASVVLFQLRVSLQLVLGLVVATASLLLYYLPPATLHAVPPPPPVRLDRPGSLPDLAERDASSAKEALLPVHHHGHHVTHRERSPTKGGKG